MDTQPLSSKPHLDNGPQVELNTRDLQDLDNDQLKEVLETVQFETTRREEAASPHCSPLGQYVGPWSSSEANMDDREVTF